MLLGNLAETEGWGGSLVAREVIGDGDLRSQPIRLMAKVTNCTSFSMD